jgi:hypothetical protein
VGSRNTAIGNPALLNNTDGDDNTAIGAFALRSDTVGNENTAVGSGALSSNNANHNTAIGANALSENTTGLQNTACGVSALTSNTTGDDNTVLGMLALTNSTTGSDNTAVGYGALANATTGSSNTALGNAAGLLATDGDGNVYIGAHMHGVAGEANTTYIRNVYDSQATTRIVYVDSNNKIGTLSSSRRYKEGIRSMDKASEALFALKPVTFRYKQEIDHGRALSFGLIAEDVAEISPYLITRDRDGKPETVRYDQVNAMLLNEFLKEHRKVQELESHLAEQRKQIERLSAGLQKVSAQLEMNRPAPQVVENAQ